LKNVIFVFYVVVVVVVVVVGGGGGGCGGGGGSDDMKKFQVIKFYSFQMHYPQKNRVFILLKNKKFYTECIFSPNCYIF